MAIKRENLDLFDLLSEKHFSGKEWIQDEWNKKSDIHLSITEWFILHLLQYKTCTAAEISKNAEITRQATHKAIKKLEEIKLVETSFSQKNKRMKLVTLTLFGKDCYMEHKALRTNLENQIKERIGEEQFSTLKSILASNWSMNIKDEVIIDGNKS